jgi:hypothetical protein
MCNMAERKRKSNKSGLNSITYALLNSNNSETISMI